MATDRVALPMLTCPTCGNPLTSGQRTKTVRRQGITIGIDVPCLRCIPCGTIIKIPEAEIAGETRLLEKWEDQIGSPMPAPHSHRKPNRRDGLLHVCFLPSEKEEIRRRARAAGKSVSSYIRDELFQKEEP